MLKKLMMTTAAAAFAVARRPDGVMKLPLISDIPDFENQIDNRRPTPNVDFHEPGSPQHL